MPARPGIGFGGKSELIKVMRDLGDRAALFRSAARNRRGDV
jgi:hypothetical protein